MSPHRPHSPSITYAIIPFLNSYSTTHSFFLLYSIHHSPLSYLHPILHHPRILFPLFLSNSILIALHLSLILFQSILHHPHSPFPFFLSNSILIAMHLSLMLFQSILHHPHIPFPFFLSTSILIAMHLPPTLPIFSPPFTHSFPHSLSSILHPTSLSPTHNLPPIFATIGVRGLHTYIE